MTNEMQFSETAEEMHASAAEYEEQEIARFQATFSRSIGEQYAAQQKEMRDSFHAARVANLLASDSLD
jgi:hypothetical protein